MKFELIRYEGTSPYTDRTPMRNAWEPGEEKLVSEVDAKLLMRYLEFKRVPAVAKKAAKAEKSDKAGTEPTSKTDDSKDDNAAALAQAQKATTEQLLREKQASEQIEATLLEVSHMTKNALSDFAKANYGVKLDMKDKADDLRNQVTALVQGGLN
ncbi:hypothetical protein IB236_13140 [Acidovorax sp. ACV02]|uniref:hypothetical protein n=1 Tax=Acidovorax sp. ACV02 TaxID=2769310 RepID=UPI00177CB35E|nr:hypothetical protein [Acidovorax sp. ACV02]MBD9406287.1 hypothetical protein [Acidovorax sp. ACV02]